MMMMMMMIQRSMSFRIKTVKKQQDKLQILAQWQNVGLWPVSFACPAFDLQLKGDHLCG